MKKLARIVSIALAMSLMTIGGAHAARGARAPAKALSGQKARAAIVKNRRAKNHSVNKLTVRRTQSHNKMTEFTAADGNGKVRKYQVANDGSYAREAGGRVTQRQGRAIANPQFHKERGKGKGQFSGLRDSGITENGNLRYTSKTDRNERVYVNANTGQSRRVDGGKAKARKPAAKAQRSSQAQQRQQSQKTQQAIKQAKKS